MTNGAAQAGTAGEPLQERDLADDAEVPSQGGDPAGAGSAPGGEAPKAGDQGRAARRCTPTPGRLPATLYERWEMAFGVDGAAFGKKVRELREARHWTQKDLSHRTGVPISTISELENGISSRPRAALNMTMAEAFGYEHPGALLGLPEPAGPAQPRTIPLTGPALGAGAEWETSALGQEAERVLAGMLRGLWTAQDERGERRGRVTRLVAIALGVAEVSDETPPLGQRPVEQRAPAPPSGATPPASGGGSGDDPAGERLPKG